MPRPTRHALTIGHVRVDMQRRVIATRTREQRAHPRQANPILAVICWSFIAAAIEAVVRCCVGGWSAAHATTASTTHVAAYPIESCNEREPAHNDRTVVPLSEGQAAEGIRSVYRKPSCAGQPGRDGRGPDNKYACRPQTREGGAPRKRMSARLKNAQNGRLERERSAGGSVTAWRPERLWMR